MEKGWSKLACEALSQGRTKKKTSSAMLEVFTRAGYGARTRGLNFGKVACYHYTKPAQFN